MLDEGKEQQGEPNKENTHSQEGEGVSRGCSLFASGWSPVTKEESDDEEMGLGLAGP